MIIEIEYFSNNNYLKEFIDALAKEINITISTKLKNYKLLIWVDKKSKNLELFLKAIENNLPYSIFMGKVEVRDGEFFENQERALLPNSISLCPKCIKEILDPNSRRYFYPFTFCRSCGFTSSFLISYPFNRENSLFFPFNICDDCKKEQEENPFRANFPLISCTKCSIPIKLQKRNSQKIFWAWDKKEYKEIFYICAQAILDNKNLLIKTFNGYKLFSKTPSREFDIFITNSNKISSYFLLLEEEKKALFSIEKPKVRATLSNLDLQKKVGSIKYLKAPDCGISILFAKALQDSGIDYIYFKEVDNIDNISYDLKLDFDLPISKYEDIVYSINKKDKFIAKGDRVILPKLLDINKDEVLDKPYVALKYQNSILIDKIEKFNIDKEKIWWIWISKKYIFTIKEK
ncbi:MAG: hypothetical protein GXO02_06315, partial [Epsilonproteobacteria bacterium]|nr:hypothetical protein [Campylobacterota bacterium]